MINLVANLVPTTRRIQLAGGQSLEAERRFNSDGTVYVAAKLYNATGGALTKNRPYMVTFGGSAKGAPNPRVTALAAVADAGQLVVIADEAVANNSWGWFAIQGEHDCGVEGTTDVVAGDFLKVSAGVSTAGLVKDGTARTQRSVAIALEAQTADSVVVKRVFLFGGGVTSDNSAVAGVLSLANGSAAAPSLTFTSDPDSGIYRVGSDAVGLAAGGVTVAFWNNLSFQMSDGKNIAFQATTGTRIGTAPTQKMAFWNATPVVQPATIADVNNSTVDTTYGTEERDVIIDLRTKLNLVVTRLKTLGLIASS